MPTGIKVSGAWKDFASISVKVGGAWKSAAGYIRIAGAWKPFFTPGGGGGGVGPCTISGPLDVTSTAISPTGPSEVVTVALGNTGQIQVRNLVVASGTPQLKNGAAAFATVADNDILTWVSGNGIQARGLGMTSATSIAFDLYDVDTNTLIQPVAINRT